MMYLICKDVYEDDYSVYISTEEQMEIQKLEDTLKKNSECNEEMAKLFAQYKELNR